MIKKNNSIKIHAFIAQQGITSRRKAEQLVLKKKVTINGKPAHVGQRINPNQDEICIDNKIIQITKKQLYYLVYKPIGVISSVSDEHKRKNVTDLLPQLSMSKKSNKQKPRLYPVGRLDKDSEGLLLLTNDGTLTQKMTHPSYQVKKTYYVLLDRRPTQKAIDHLKKGVKLNDGFTKKAEVSFITDDQDKYLQIIHTYSKKTKHPIANTGCWISITIKEGRNHQVRRMMKRVGYTVIRLIRVKMGEFSLQQLEGKNSIKISL